MSTTNCRRDPGRTCLIFVLFLLGLLPASISVAQEAQSKPQQCCAGLEFLLGKWEAAGGGEPGSSSGLMTYARDLDGRVIVRRNESRSPQGIHSDLMIIYQDSAQDPAGVLRGDFFDSEGHVILYTITVTSNPQSAVFLHPATETQPGFRFTHTSKPDGSADLLFEIARPGTTQFVTYLKGNARRTP